MLGQPLRPDLLITRDFPPEGGGIARWMSEMATRYPPGSLLVSTGTVRGRQQRDDLFPNRIDRLPFPATRLKLAPGVLLWSHRVARLVAASQPGFIWCGTLRPAAYAAKWAHLRTGTPYGLVFHGGDLLTLQQSYRASRRKGLAARWLIGSAAVLVTNSQWTRQLAAEVLRDLGIAWAVPRLHVIPLGTDPAVFRPGVEAAPFMRAHGLPDGRWLVTVARLVPHKGLDIAIQAFARLREDFPDLRYAIVGTGPQAAALHELARSCGVAGAVTFLDEVAAADLPALYNMAEIYVGLSRQTSRAVEGFGIALLEASACGKPIVAGRSGGIPEAVCDGETGLLVDPESPAAVAGALRALLRAPQHGRDLGAAGRHAVETFLHWDRVIADMRQLSQRHSVR
ncbi:MAG: glycosyltransferase family 4 protein [Candidatus Tectimicrobiota bacterium]